MWYEVLISCLLLQVVENAKSQPRYLVLFHSQLQSLTTSKVCVHIAHYDASFNLNITLVRGGKSQPIFINNVPAPYLQESSIYYNCASFKVPFVKYRSYNQGIVANLSVTALSTSKKVLFSEEKKVLIINPGSGTFMQTDKPIYKQGEKVRCRIVTLDSKFISVNDTYPLVEIQDPQSNRIGQWLNLKPNQGIAEFSFDLNPEAMLGDYTIHLKKASEEDVYTSITVTEYVLQKIEVTFKTPKNVNVLDPDFQFYVCGSYTYGQPTKGAVSATVCRNAYFWMYFRKRDGGGNGICQQFSGMTDLNGCFLVSVNTEEYLKNSFGYQSLFDITASLEEEGTGIKQSGSVTIPISMSVVTLEFQNVSYYYRSGIPFTGKIIMQDSHENAIPNRPVYLSSSYSAVQINTTVITDATGVASFSLITNDWTGSIQLRASYLPGEPADSSLYDDTYHYIEEFYSNSESYLSIKRQYNELQSGVPAKILVNYHLSAKELLAVNQQVIFYMGISRGSILLTGQHTVAVLQNLKKDLEGSFSIIVNVSPDCAPELQILVYSLLSNGAAMADSFNFPVVKFFEYKPALHFTKAVVLPGAKVPIQILAPRNSLCALRIVDESVLLLKPETEITADLVYRILPVQNLNGYPYQVNEYNTNPCSEEIYYYYFYENYLDTFNVFKNSGIKVMTNYDIKKPILCPTRHPSEEMSSGLQPVAERMKMQALQGPDESSNNGGENKARTDFSEVWLWRLEKIGDSITNFSITAPDSITKWKGTMFCTSSVGFGLADATSVTTFKPFFVEPALPYSMVRGETVDLNVKAFNYLKECIMVQVTLAHSTDYVAVPCANCQYTSCLCGNEDKTFVWSITPKTIGTVNFTITVKAIQTAQLCNGQVPVVPTEGKSDTVIKSLLVEISAGSLQVSSKKSAPVLPTTVAASGSSATQKVPVAVSVQSSTVQQNVASVNVSTSKVQQTLASVHVSPSTVKQASASVQVPLLQQKMSVSTPVPPSALQKIPASIPTQSSTSQKPSASAPLPPAPPSVPAPPPPLHKSAVAVQPSSILQKHPPTMNVPPTSLHKVQPSVNAPSSTLLQKAAASMSVPSSTLQSRVEEWVPSDDDDDDTSSSDDSLGHST
ncbi:alpha-2-macroglobulin-like protein 1 [Protopterus annectens]|uniref:alpha-2-macroglobulin-like protein 1 n=1 Tax=Protopterus annectens TaxID=7888 RepID=UPI001CFB1062|nr:alpha-2-macroglobulin-like protein 1 [Protopterus annectens]